MRCSAPAQFGEWLCIAWLPEECDYFFIHVVCGVEQGIVWCSSLNKAKGAVVQQRSSEFVVNV